MEDCTTFNYCRTTSFRSYTLLPSQLFLCTLVTVQTILYIPREVWPWLFAPALAPTSSCKEHKMIRK